VGIQSGRAQVVEKLVLAGRQNHQCMGSVIGAASNGPIVAAKDETLMGLSLVMTPTTPAKQKAPYLHPGSTPKKYRAEAAYIATQITAAARRTTARQRVPVRDMGHAPFWGVGVRPVRPRWRISIHAPGMASAMKGAQSGIVLIPESVAHEPSNPKTMPGLIMLMDIPGVRGEYMTASGLV
jgi:hypothetical protein